MNNLGVVEASLREFSECFPEGNRIAVPTQHLYPSHKNVTVYIEPFRIGEFRVSDNGGAVDELSALGYSIVKPDTILRSSCRRFGVTASQGVIHSESVAKEALSAAIIVVAAASARAVEDGMEKLKPSRHRDLSSLVRDVMQLRFSPDLLHKSYMLSGESNHQHTFELCAELPGKARLLVDVVYPEIGSINARVVSHLDVSRLNDPLLKQRIVFDDEDEWGAPELHLLQMAAPVVPLSKFDGSVKPLLLH